VLAFKVVPSIWPVQVWSKTINIYRTMKSEWHETQSDLLIKANQNRGKSFCL
jgi:cbb3-type cytochrome oxidase subunit 1